MFSEKHAHDLYELSVAHRKVHKCGGQPNDIGAFLSHATSETNARFVIEIGTAIGYSAYCFASAHPDVRVITIDKELEHVEIASEQWKMRDVNDQIEMFCGMAQNIIPTLTHQADIIFFDGYAPLPELVSEYSRLVSKNGILISTNLELPSERVTTPQYMKALDHFGFTTYRDGDLCFSSQIPEITELWATLYNTTQS